MRVSMVLGAISALAAATPAPAPAAEANAEGPLPHGKQTFKWEKYNCNSLDLDNYFDTGVITARCPRIGEDGKETYMWSALNLTNFVTNDNGEMKWRKDGKAFNTCTDIWATGEDTDSPVINADCFVPRHDAQTTSIELNTGVYNRNGILASYEDYGVALARDPDADRDSTAKLLPQGKRAPEDVEDQWYHEEDEAKPSGLAQGWWNIKTPFEFFYPPPHVEIFEDGDDSEVVKREEREYNCKHLALHDDQGKKGVITAHCPAVDGIGKDVIITSFLDLNQCLGNFGGNLVWRPNGNAFSSCDNAYIADGNSDKPILAADCNVPGKRASKAVVRLSEAVYNYHGVLACLV